MMKKINATFWSRAPLVRIAILFGIGIFLEDHFLSQIDVFKVVAPGVVVASILLEFKVLTHRFEWRHFVGIGISFSLILAGILLSNSFKLHITHADKINTEAYSKLIYEVKTELVEKKNSYQFQANIVHVLLGDSLRNTKQSVLCYLSKDCRDIPKIGDILHSESRPKTIKKGQSNYYDYLRRKGVRYSVFLPSSTVLLIDNHDNLSSRLVTLRENILDNMQKNGVGEESLQVIGALCLGKKTDLSKEIKQTFAHAGALHILAVSGLHVGIVFLMLSFCTRPLKKIKFGRHIQTAILLSGLWIYAGLTGLSPSVLRSATMFTVIVLAQTTNRSTNIYNTLAASALILLIFTPTLLFSVGFQLSYTAVIGIVYMQPKLYKSFYFENKMLNWMWQIGSVSIAAQLATFPLGMYYFHEFPNYFLLTNFIAIPAATIILILGLAFCLTGWINIMAMGLGYMLNKSGDILFYFMQGIESLPYSSSGNIHISLTNVLCFYLVMVSTCVWLSTKKGKHFHYLLASCIFLIAGL